MDKEDPGWQGKTFLNSSLYDTEALHNKNLQHFSFPTPIPIPNGEDPKKSIRSREGIPKTPQHTTKNPKTDDRDILLLPQEPPHNPGYTEEEGKYGQKSFFLLLLTFYLNFTYFLFPRNLEKLAASYETTCTVRFHNK